MSELYIVEKLFPVESSIGTFNKIEKLIKEIQIDVDTLEVKIEKNDFKNVFEILHSKCGWRKDDFMFLKPRLPIMGTPMHGDLTSNNIMHNKKGKFVLIDLDRFVMNGYENFDRLHYIVEYFTKRIRKSFFETVLYALNHKNLSQQSLDKLLLYFFCRIDLQYVKDVDFPINYYKNICKVMHVFLTYKSELEGKKRLKEDVAGK